MRSLPASGPPANTQRVHACRALGRWLPVCGDLRVCPPSAVPVVVGTPHAPHARPAPSRLAARPVVCRLGAVVPPARTAQEEDSDRGML
eukprot:2406018-Prymnesium_polylepis.1